VSFSFLLCSVFAEIMRFANTLRFTLVFTPIISLGQAATDIKLLYSESTKSQPSSRSISGTTVIFGMGSIVVDDDAVLVCSKLCATVEVNAEVEFDGATIFCSIQISSD
jgi:hypothetical protein